MIQLYNKGQTDFSKKGITLNAQKAAVTFQDNGRFDMDLTMPIPEHIEFDYGMIIRCSVPEQHVPEITLGQVSYYEVSNAEGSTLWSVIPTLKKIKYKQWVGYSQTEGIHVYSVGDKVTYLGNNYRCTQFDPESQQAAVPPNNSSWWERIPNTTGTAGKPAAEVEDGDILMKTADFNDEYMEAATLDGKTGYIKIADVTATGDTETRTIPAQTIRAQNFTITEIEKSSDGKQVTIHAEHVSYGLGRTILGDCNLVNVNPATAVLFIQGAMKEEYGGEIYTNLPADLSITANWSWKNAQNAILDPKAGLLQFTAGQMIRNDLNVFLINKGEAIPKYSVKYGTNLTAVKFEGSVAETITRIYPTAQSADGATLLLPEEHIDTVRVVPFIRPEVLNTGLKVGQKETQSDGTEIELTEDIIFTRMRQAAQNRFSIDECDKIDIQMEVDWIHLPDTEEYKPFAALRNAAPNEWVRVTSGPLGVSETIQLTGYTFDPILERYEKATFGKNKVSPGVASYDIQTGAIGSRALGAGAVRGENIQAESITAREIEAGSITADQIASRSIVAEIIAANAITAEAINAGSVTAEKIAAHAITADQIASHTITADEIAAGAITADAIASGTIQAVHIMSEAITADKIAAGAVEASKIAALAITTEKLAAGAVEASKIAAGAITASKIDTTDIEAINATLGTANIATAVVESADINYAHIKDLDAQSAFFGQAVFQEALGGKLYVPRLAANYAQIVNATISDLVIQATNDNFYKLDVDLSGNVTATQITPTQQEIEDGHTADGRTIYLGTDIVAADLNTMNIYASHALMDEITANIINVDKLFAREATISKINALDLSSNTYIRSTIGDWQSGSTITQTISGINTRINQLGYGTIFYSATEPSPQGVVQGDVWIQPINDHTWDDISQYTWDQISGWTWDQVAGQYRMYVWTGTQWKLLYDNLIISDLMTEINQLAYEISLKASQSSVDVLSGKVTTFEATLTIQAREIEAAVSAVNAKTANYTRTTDPADDPLISLSVGDTWTKAVGDGTWDALADFTWDELADFTWDELAGAKVYSWTGTDWILITDIGQQLNLQTIVDQTERQVTVLAEEILTVGDQVYRNSAQITVQADRITQEVQRAQNAENGKIDKTTQYQTADAIVSEAVRQSASSASGLYIAKTQVYQSAEAIVQTAETYAANAANAAEAAAKGASIAKTTQLQTADAIVSEAVRQSGVNAAGAYIAKTQVYQSADAIYSSATSYAASAANSAEANAKSYAAQVAAAAEAAAKNASILRTETYQSAAAIVTAAQSYTNGKLTDYSTTVQTAQQIAQYVGSHAYGLVSGITIVAAGIDISGSQYVNIASGGWFKVKTGDFGIDTNVAASGYAIWAGGSSGDNASFRVKKNGEVTLTKLLALGENGSTTEVNLRTAGLWKLNYQTIKQNTITTDSDGKCTSFTLSNGTVVNFKSAASVDFASETLWTSGDKTLTLTNGKQKTVSIPDPTEWSGTYIGKVQEVPTEAVTVQIGGKAFNGTVDASGAYNAGSSAGAAAVDFASESLWNAGSKVLTLSNGKTHTVNIPSTASWSSYWYSDRGVSVTCSVGGRSFTQNFSH